MKLINLVALIIITVLCTSSNLNHKKDLEEHMLQTSDLPDGYQFTDELTCKSIQAQSFYEKPELYAMMIGNVTTKKFQSFESKKDSGTILYFEFDKDFEHTGFLEGLLWGGNKPTSQHPEEYLAKENILIIWSTSKKSQIKAISKAKIEALSK